MISDVQSVTGLTGVHGEVTNEQLGGLSGMAGSMIVEPGMTQADDAGSRDNVAPSTSPRYSRRLSDKILVAFHHACDQGDFEVGEQLLHVLEMMLTRRPLTQDGTRRRNMESLVAAHERLWHLRHPETDKF